MTYRILSIDGGGIRGIIPATVLTEFETLLGNARSIIDLFDLIVGTSTGRILALGLTCPRADGSPRPASAMRDLYLNHGADIFPLGGSPYFGPPKENWILGDRARSPAGTSLADKFKSYAGYHNLGRLFAFLGGGTKQGNARYSAEPLEQQLRIEVGETLMSQALRPVMVVSCDLRTHEPLLFRGGGIDQGPLGDAPMWKAARATSAGPTFFPAMVVEDPRGMVHECVDGGLVANDPASVGYMEALSLLSASGRSREDILLVSIGTGLGPDSEPPEVHDLAQLVDQRSWFQLAPPVVGAMSSAQGELMRQQMKQALGEAYVRLQTPLKFGAVHAMDNTQPENLRALRLTGDDLVETSKPVLQRLTQLTN